MWPVRPFRAGVIAVCALFTVGCAGTVVFADRHRESPTTDVLRVATERGLKDRSDDESLRIEIPLEVRAKDQAITLPGCAVRAFRTDAVTGPDFSLEALREVDDLRVVVSEEDTFIPANRRRLVTLTLIGRVYEEGEAGIGIRLDENPEVLERSAEPGQTAIVCPEISMSDSLTQHYGLRPIEVESAGVGLTAAAIMLVAIVGIAGR